MSRYGDCKFDGLKELQQKLENFQKQEIRKIMEACAKELTARLLALVIKNTPVGDYSVEKVVTAKRTSKNHKKGEQYTIRVNPSGKLGGTLRRGWASKTQKEAEDGTGKTVPNDIIKKHVDSLRMIYRHHVFRIEVTNPVEYASYVEYGHRKKNHEGWVPGRFMLTISEQELQSIAPRVLENKINKLLKENFK